MNKKLYLASFLYFFTFSNIAFSMNKDQATRLQILQEKIQTVDEGTSKNDINAIKQEMRSLLKTNAGEIIYRKLALKIHPDHCRDNVTLEDLMKALNNAKDNRNNPLFLTPEEVAKIKKDIEKVESWILQDNEKIEQQKIKIANVDLLLKPINRALMFAAQGLQELSQSFISHVVDTFFTLLSDRYIMVRHPEDSIVHQNILNMKKDINIILSNQNILRDELKQNKEYNIHLEKTVTQYDKAIKRKLSMHLAKENRC